LGFLILGSLKKAKTFRKGDPDLLKVTVRQGPSGLALLRANRTESDQIRVNPTFQIWSLESRIPDIGCCISKV
jgi:hypothetical protein